MYRGDGSPVPINDLVPSRPGNGAICGATGLSCCECMPCCSNKILKSNQQDRPCELQGIGQEPDG